MMFVHLLINTTFYYISVFERKKKLYIKLLFLFTFLGNYADSHKYYYKNTGDDSYMLHINPNTNNPEYCYLDDSGSESFPNGVISCTDPKPSGAAKVFEIKLKSNDETKVIIDSSNNGFTYDVSG